MAKSKNVVIKSNSGDWPLTKKESFVQVKNTAEKKTAIKKGGRAANAKDNARVKNSGKNFNVEQTKDGRKKTAAGKPTKHREKISRMRGGK
jgi:hypothetical protein